jgi:hypothetical protein
LALKCIHVHKLLLYHYQVFLNVLTTWNLNVLSKCIYQVIWPSYKSLWLISSFFFWFFFGSYVFLCFSMFFYVFFCFFFFGYFSMEGLDRSIMVGW